MPKKRYTEEYKIQRKSHTIITPAYSSQQASVGGNNIWFWDRAPDGMKFELVSAVVTVGTHYYSSYGVVALFDGRVFNTRWDIFPGVEDFELLGRCSISPYQPNVEITLKGWECKEYTIGARSTQVDTSFIANVIIWYYLRPMSRYERVMYAVLHPKRKTRKGGPTTVELTEAD